MEGNQDEGEMREGIPLEIAEGKGASRPVSDNPFLMGVPGEQGFRCALRLDNTSFKNQISTSQY